VIRQHPSSGNLGQAGDESAANSSPARDVSTPRCLRYRRQNLQVSLRRPMVAVNRVA